MTRHITEELRLLCNVMSYDSCMLVNLWSGSLFLLSIILFVKFLSIAGFLNYKCQQFKQNNSAIFSSAFLFFFMNVFHLYLFPVSFNIKGEGFRHFYQFIIFFFFFLGIWQKIELPYSLVYKDALKKKKETIFLNSSASSIMKVINTRHFVH